TQWFDTWTKSSPGWPAATLDTASLFPVQVTICRSMPVSSLSILMVVSSWRSLDVRAVIFPPLPVLTAAAVVGAAAGAVAAAAAAVVGAAAGAVVGAAAAGALVAAAAGALVGAAAGAVVGAAAGAAVGALA